MALPLTTACQTRIGLAAIGRQPADRDLAADGVRRSLGDGAGAANGNVVPASDESKLQLGVLNLLVRAALVEQIAKN